MLFYLPPAPSSSANISRLDYAPNGLEPDEIALIETSTKYAYGEV